MPKKYTNEEHLILSKSAIIITEQMFNIRKIIHEDSELLNDLRDAANAFKNFSKKMQER